MIIDVESIGLHGEGFAVGFVVINSDDGEVIEEGLYCCDPKEAWGHYNEANSEWVEKNIPKMEFNCKNPEEVRDKFWNKWIEWKEKNTALVGECIWPVEANFISACIGDNEEDREWKGPYPLYDISAMLLMIGIDPLETLPRKENELPEHDPLNDARQSMRILNDIMEIE